MIDLTPLDVRKKRGDFAKKVRGFDPEEVDAFLELAAERMEVLVKENLAFREEIEHLEKRVVVQEGREQAVQDALVTAQALRQDVEKQARKEAELLEREARERIKGMVSESEKLIAEHTAALNELERQRERFLKSFRTLLERELDTVEVELGRAPLWKGSWSIVADGDGPEDTDENEDGDEAENTADETGAENTADDNEAEATENRVDDDEAEHRADGDEEAAAEDHGEGTVEPEAAEAVGGSAVGGEAHEGHDLATEGKRDDSLWLSSIIKDENTE